MKNWRNLLFLLAFLGFGVWYGGTWAYRTQYVEPRKKLKDEIEKAELLKEQYETEIKIQQARMEFLTPLNLHYRSLPTGNAETLYHSWLLEAGEQCRFDDLEITFRGNLQTQSYFRIVSFHLYAETTLDDLSRFLYEFYWAPFIHRISFLDILPVEGADLVDIEMHIEGLVLDRPPNSQYPLPDRLPYGYHRRLTSGLLETYTEPVNSRNLLQFSRGGVDAADFTRLTAIVYIGGKPEFWFNSQLENRTYRVLLNEQFRIGSFIAKVVEVVGDGIKIEQTGTSSRPSSLWILSPGELLTEGMWVPF